MSSQSSVPADFHYCLAPVDPLARDWGDHPREKSEGLRWSVDGKGSSCLGLEKIGQRGMVVFSSILRSLNIVEFQNHGPSPVKESRTSQGTAQ